MRNFLKKKYISIHYYYIRLKIFILTTNILIFYQKLPRNKKGLHLEWQPQWTEKNTYVLLSKKNNFHLFFF